jgi:hypothetical protein
VSETDARTIARRVKARETEKGRSILKARAGIDDHLGAKELGMTVEEYRKLIWPKV